MLRLNTSQYGWNKVIRSTKIPWNTSISERYLTKIYESLARKMERDYNVMPNKILNLLGVSKEIITRKLDKWLEMVPDESI